MQWKQIYEGWKNHLLPSEQLKDLIEQVSDERLTLCKHCPFNSTCGEITNLSYCKACGCNLKAKTKCLSCKCGIDTLNSRNSPESQLNVLWDAVTTTEEHDTIKNEIQKLNETES